MQSSVESSRLPPNPANEWIRIRDEFRRLRRNLGEDAPELDPLREKGAVVYHEVRHFIETNGGVLVRNGSTQKAIDWFEIRRAAADTLLIREPRVIDLPNAAGGGKTLEQPQLLDLGVLILRQVVDIKRQLNSRAQVNKRMALRRGLATAHAVNFTPVLDELKPGEIVRSDTKLRLLLLDRPVISWLQSVDINIIPKPQDCIE